MGLDQPIDITAEQRKTLLTLLNRHLPNTTAWLYGSRAKWTARPQSDLDMVVFATPKQSARVSDLREAFEESNLPFRVDLFTWDTVPEEFRRPIEANHVVLVEKEELSMADGWRETTLGNVIEFKRGYDLPKRERKPGAVPIVSSSGLTGKHSESKVHGPGVVTGRYGTLGQIFFISGDFWPLNTTLYVRDFKGNDPRFVSYFLRGLDFSAYSDKAAVPGLNRNHIHQEIVRIPSDVREQRAIARILGTLDDKIELNRRMNETLEAMAQALFKSWFIDFDPVHAKVVIKNHSARKVQTARYDHTSSPFQKLPSTARTPAQQKNNWTPKRARGYLDRMDPNIAALFPDCFIESELGKIPNGWKLVVIEDLADISSGKRPPAKYTAPSQLAQVPLWGGNGPMAFVPESLVEGPILLTGRVGTLGSIFRITAPCWPSDNTLIFLVKNKRAFEFLFLQLKRIDFKSLNCGSTQPLVTQTSLKAQIVLLPPANVLERFHTFTETLYALLDQSEIESRTLIALRNTLLPKLMAGELSATRMEMEAP